MTKLSSSGIIFCSLLLIALIVLPASGVAASSTTAAPVTTAASATAGQPFISASASPANATAGKPVTISGVATGGNLSAGVQIWVFAGNYVNVSTVPVSADGSFSKTYQTTGLPTATYYVIVQSPGKDGVLNIDMETTGQYSGQVVNTKTASLVFNFTGTGSVQDSAAAQALSDAFNLPGVDDIYTKCTFQLMAPGTSAESVTTLAPESTTVAPTPVATTKKSPLSPFTLLAGSGIAGLAIAWRSRR
ncbi:MAG: hypothetical protein ABSG49_03615 [Methanoregula sp.]|jgi:hypothetical protein|uniref:hypothetical protein n=1 Tax=Methanoregula sp. TaxID=2052170 RepID=UPI003C20F73C